MNPLHTSLKCLRTSFILSFVIGWNLLFLIAVSLNGGFGPIRSAASALVVAIACAALAFVGFGSLSLTSVRSIVLRPTAELAMARPCLIFFGILGSALSLGSIFTALNHP